MTSAEVWKLVTVVRAYPQYRTATPEDLDGLHSLWSMALGEYSYREASAALAAWVKTDVKGFPPVPGQIIDKIHGMKSNGELTASEAFSAYWDAVCDGIYNAKAKFDALPEIVQRVAGSAANISAAAMDENTNYDVEKALFEKKYHIELSRMKEEAKIPASIRNLIAQADVGALPG